GRCPAGLVPVLAAAAAAVGAVTYVSLHSSLLRQLDQQLRQANVRSQACLGLPPPGHEHDSDSDNQPPPPHRTPDECAQQQQARTFSAQVRNGALTDNHLSYAFCELSHADKAV